MDTKETDFDALLDEYKNKITKGTSDSFMPILNSLKHTILERHKDAPNIDEIFNHRIIALDIIDAGIKYIDNTTKVISESSITKYLNSITDFYKKIIQVKYPNSSLNSVLNFQDLYSDIRQNVKKDLLPTESYPHIGKDEYKFVNSHISVLSSMTGKNFSISVIYRLMLLFGFKLEIVENLKAKNYDSEKRTLCLESKFSNKELSLELPYNLSRDMSIQKSKDVGSPYLFVNDGGNKIDSDYFADDLKDLKAEAAKYGFKKACFTLSGFSKFGVINMLVEGLNPLTVKDVSGISDTNLKYCEKQAIFLLERENLNHHINAHIRGIRTFDDFE